MMNNYNFTGSASSTLSDNSENSIDESLSPISNADSICRDFLRHVCRRGNHCRYRHPDANEARRISHQQQEYLFCHDFQNAGCRRSNCRFIHCSREEEDAFRRTGQLPVHLAQAAALGFIASEPGLAKGEAPVCKDFLKGECKRGVKCKYRHLTSAAYEQELICDHQSVIASSSSLVVSAPPDEPASKKRKMNEGIEGLDYYDTCRVVTLADYQLLMEENQLLRRKVDDLKRHLSVLVATNELLLEQNARYRACKLITVPPNAPIVAVSQMLTPTITPALATSRPTAVTALHQGPHGITTMATLSRVTFNGNREIVMSQPTLHSLVHQQVNMSVAQPPPAIDPSVSMAIVPMTIPMDAAMAGSNLGAVSLSQGQPPPQTLTALNMTPQPSLSNMIANSNLVSYPIISQTQMANQPSTSLG